MCWPAAVGAEVPGDESYYYRTAPVFQTDAPGRRWLAENQFPGVVLDEEGQVSLGVRPLRV